MVKLLRDCTILSKFINVQIEITRLAVSSRMRGLTLRRTSIISKVGSSHTTKALSGLYMSQRFTEDVSVADLI